MASDKLYKLAAAYHRRKLFFELDEEDIFGVRLPSGEIAYCSAVGNRDEDYFALSIHVGKEEFNKFRDVLFYRERDDFFPNEVFFRVSSQNFFQCAFESKDHISPAELAAEKDFSKRNKIYFRQKFSHPRFLKFLPFGADVPVETEEEEKILELALAAAVEVGEKYPDELPPKIKFIPGTAANRKFPLLTPDGEKFQWSMEKLPPYRLIKYPVPKLKPILMKKLQQAKKFREYCCEIFILPQPFKNNITGKVTTLVLIIALDVESSIMLQIDPTETYSDKPEDLAEKFFRYCLKNGVPKKIFVRSERTYTFLEEICEEAGIELEALEDIPDLDEAEDKLLGNEEDVTDEINDKLEEIFMMIEEMPAEFFKRAIPKEMKSLLQNLLDEGRIPARIKRKVMKIIG